VNEPTPNSSNPIDRVQQKTQFYDQVSTGTAKINLFVTRQPAATWFVVALFTLNCVFLLTATIQMSDTDTWYHLAGGRHFFEVWQTSNPFDRSYLTEVNEFHNYFWGFQALLYSAWLSAGFIGISLLKATLILVTGYVLMRIITRDQSISEASFSQLFVLALLIYLLSMRGISIRPHYFSYLFIPLFSYILIYRRHWIPALPVLTLVWINTHGVEWVIGALICGSFTLQQILIYLRTRDTGELQPCIWVMICVPVTLLNPSGYHVLLTPFLAPPEIYQFISELGPFDYLAALDFGAGFNSNNAGLLLMGIVFFGLFRIGTANLSENIFPILLAVGGAILVARGARFLWEGALLTAPLFALIVQSDATRIDLKRFAGLLLFLLVLARSFFLVNQPLIHAYPFAEDTLPRGTTDFVENLGIEGNYLLPAAYSGYVEWRLPRIKVHMDLQLPPFDSFDYFESFSAQHSAAGFLHLVNKYKPGIIGVTRANTNFADIVTRDMNYVPVIYDQLLVLYLHRSTYPDIANRYRLKHVNPFSPDNIQTGSEGEVTGELERMLSVTANLPDVRLTLAGFLIAQGRFEEAQRHLEILAQWQPLNQSVLFFQADIAHKEGDYETAISKYVQLFELTDERHKIGPLLGECYFRSEDYLNAYKAFSASINPYRDVENNLLHYYFYAFSSYMTGDLRQARKLIRIIEALYQGDNEPLIQEVQALKRILKG
jgi:tetratricopeptide (TPR) repeat protein